MKKYLFLIVCIVVTASSCVPKRLLLSSQKHIQNLQGDSSNTHSKLNSCNTSLSDCNTKLDDTNSKLTACNGSVKKLQDDSASLQTNLDRLSSSSQATISSSQATINDQAKKLKDLQALIQAQKDVMNKLKKTVADALVNFKPDELTVSIKDGKLYVSLQEKLLFKSGSDVVDPKGKEALQTVAKVLNNNPDISVMIEGHTDSIPIHGKFEDNWALSVARATSIVRILTTDYSVDARRVEASGRGEYFPVAGNATTEGRARNRRTEIILSPNLSELFKLLNQ